MYVYFHLYAVQMHIVLRVHTVHMDLLFLSSDNLNSDIRVS